MDRLAILSYIGVLATGFVLGRLTAGSPSNRWIPSQMNTPSPALGHDAPMPLYEAAADRDEERQDADIEELIRNDRLVNAIKLYRDRYGVNLRDAKLAVEEMEERLR